MDTSPALLLLLSLGLCEYGHGKRFMQCKTIMYLQLGAQLDLMCHISGEDTGVVWVHQDTVETFKFIVFISPLSEATFEGNQKTSTHFEARKVDVFYWLVVKSFTPQDQGNYFCIKYIDKQLYFSPGQLAFLSGRALGSSLGSSRTGCNTRLWAPAGPSLFSIPAETRMQEDLDYFCLVFLWVPLAGLCLLLLQLLAITIVLCRRKAHHNP
ncbi:CD8A protein, partial [Callaeas wilsoni]|nr:CD8A protein [Callaeas wilsoni]